MERRDAAPKAAAEPHADFGEGSSSEDSSSPAVPMAAKKSAAAKAPPEPPFLPGATPPRDAPKASRVAKSEPSSSSSEEKKKKRKDKKKAKAKKEKGGKKRKNKRSRAKGVKPSTSSDSSSFEAKDEDASEYSDWEGDDDYWGGDGREKRSCLAPALVLYPHAPLCDSLVVWRSHALSTKIRTLEGSWSCSEPAASAPLAARGTGAAGPGERGARATARASTAPRTRRAAAGNAGARPLRMERARCHRPQRPGAAAETPSETVRKAENNCPCELCMCVGACVCCRSSSGVLCAGFSFASACSQRGCQSLLEPPLCHSCVFQAADM